MNFDNYISYVAKICRDMTLDNWKPDYIVGIVRGGSIPAVMISHYFEVPCYMLKISLRDNADCESNAWMSGDAFQGKNILIVDDINDTGATINWLINDWQGSTLPDSTHWQNVWNQNVRFATIIDNLTSDCEVKIDYAGSEIEKTSWITFPYETWWTI